MNKYYYSLFFFIVLTANPRLSEEAQPRLTIWNIGQGQFITYSDLYACIHFDCGGEYYPRKKLLARCKNKPNYILLSHADLDHIKYLKRLKYDLGAKLLNYPEEPLSKRKQKLLSLIKISDSQPLNLKRLNFTKTKSMKSNDYSVIVEFKINERLNILFPGDSTKRSEKLWVSKTSKSLSHLILPHHGSKTSLSIDLLKKLSSLKQAFVSARKKRYGHPHRITLKKLKRHSVPLVDTETWGNIVLFLPYTTKLIFNDVKSSLITLKGNNSGEFK